MGRDVRTVGDRRRTVLVVMCAGYFLVLLDVTIVNTALPRIGVELGAGLDALQWVVDGYTVALAALMLAGGTIGDLYGHKRLVLVGLGLFGAASLGCGLATTVGMLNGFRVAQGLGAAVMLPGTLAVITRAYPEPGAQARAIGVWAGIGSSALVLGPLLGGVLTEFVGWRAVFLVTVPVALAVLPVAARVVRESTEPRGRHLDVPGVLLGAAALGAVTLAFIQGGRSGVDTTTLAAAGAAVVLGVAFVLVERARRHPMLPLGLFADRRFATANAVAAAMNLGTVGLLFVVNLYLQGVLGYSALAAGLALLPLYVPLCALAAPAGRLTSRFGPRTPMVVGLLAAAVGVALLVGLDARSGVVAMWASLLLWGAGLGVLTPAVVAAAVHAVPPARAGLASAVNNTARQAGQAIGIAGLGALAGPANGPGFLPGFHAGAVGVAALFAAGAVATWLTIPGTPRPS